MLHVPAAKNLAEGALTADFVNDISIAEMLTQVNLISTILLKSVRGLRQPVVANSVDHFVMHDLLHFEWSQEILVISQRLR